MNISIFNAETNEKLFCIENIIHDDIENLGFSFGNCDVEQNSLNSFISQNNKDKNVYIKVTKPPKQNKKLVTVRTFGKFDVFIDGHVVNFHSVKAKELFALCIDRRGGSVSIEEATDTLWENRPFDDKVKKLYTKAVMNIRQTFSSFGITDVFCTARGYCNVNMDLIICDYYSFLQNDKNSIRQFDGKYMSDYSWAEETLAYLMRLNGYFEY